MEPRVHVLVVRADTPPGRAVLLNLPSFPSSCSCRLKMTRSRHTSAEARWAARNAPAARSPGAAGSGSASATTALRPAPVGSRPGRARLAMLLWPAADGIPHFPGGAVPPSPAVRLLRLARQLRPSARTVGPGFDLGRLRPGARPRRVADGVLRSPGGAFLPPRFRCWPGTAERFGPRPGPTGGRSQGPRRTRQRR